MSYDDDIQRLTEIERITNGNYFDMDEAFCARMLAAIEAGLESAPTSVITAPGTKNPKSPERRAMTKGAPGNCRAIPAKCGQPSFHHPRYAIRPGL